MASTDAGWPAEVDFVEYVQARQHTLLRAAYLVCGDAALAEDLTRQALVRLARQWARVRDERPDIVVRRMVYGDAVSSWQKRQGAALESTPASDETERSWDADEAEQRLEVLRGLDTLTPRQRAVVVLRFFDDRTEPDTAAILGCSVATVRTELHEAVTRLRDALPTIDLGTGNVR